MNKRAVFFVLVIASSAFAQMDHAGHHGGPVPQEILERPVTLRSGIGVAHEKVSTNSPQAQAFFDQGLAYLHSYVWIEAARSFYQALRLDPHVAMAYLGLADAYIGLEDVPSARAAWEKARALQAHMSSSEKAWLDIRGRELDSLESGGDREKFAAYQKAVDDAIEANPGDPWLRVQRGLAAEASPFTHGQASGEAALPFYQKALGIDPKNLAAFHYTIHANENLGNIKDALEQSATYARIAPAIPHAHHMHGHELMRVGRTEEAIQEFLKAKALEDAYYRAENIPAQYDWHHAHNLQLLALNYELLGQDKAAAGLLRQAFSLPASTEFLAYNRKAWPEFLINRGRFAEALEASRELAKNQWPMARMAGHALAGQAQLGMSKLDEAKQELTLADQEATRLPVRIVSALPYPAVLRGAILLREGQLRDGKSIRDGESILVEVAKMAQAMPGPDGWVTAIFTLEAIASEARAAGDWELAQFAAEQMIQHDPYYAGGHFALGLVAEHAGESDGARPMFAEAEKLWSHGDQDLPELAIARKKLAAVQ